jgi:hypothetical protein
MSLSARSANQPTFYYALKLPRFEPEDVRELVRARKAATPTHITNAGGTMAIAMYQCATCSNGIISAGGAKHKPSEPCSVIETVKIGGRGSDRLMARKLSSSNFGLLQQYRHKAAERGCLHSRRVLEGKRTFLDRWKSHNSRPLPEQQPSPLRCLFEPHG